MTAPYDDDQAGRVRELAAALSAAIAEHLRAVEARRGESDAAVFAAYDRLRDAFIAYEDALYETYDEVTPFEVVDSEDDEDDEEDEEEEFSDEEEELTDEEEEFTDEEDDDSDDEEFVEEELDEDEDSDDGLSAVSDDYDEVEPVDVEEDSGPNRP